MHELASPILDGLPEGLRTLLREAERLISDPRAPAEQVIAALVRGVERIGATDLALDRGFDALDRTRPYQEQVLSTRPDLHASVFLVPSGGELPLHDHPEMTVLLRVLAGRFEIASFDRVPGQSGLARRRPTRIVGVDDGCDVLTPSAGNFHRLRALEDGAFLDLFFPYYDDVARPCSYYREGEDVDVAGETLVRLIPAPELDPERT